MEVTLSVCRRRKSTESNANTTSDRPTAGRPTTDEDMIDRYRILTHWWRARSVLTARKLGKFLRGGPNEKKLQTNSGRQARGWELAGRDV